MELCLKELKKVECPMTWDLNAFRQSVKIDRLVGRFTERLEENAFGQTWKTVNILLFLSYEHYMAQKSIFEYISYMRHSEEILEKDCWLRKYQSAAQHVLYSTWAHLLLKMNLHRSTYYLKKIRPYKEMTDEERAFVLAVKAFFLMLYGPPGNAEALKTVTKVLELNQNEPEWWFLKGKCLARMRRLHYRSMPTAEEAVSFKKAVEMNEDCVRYLIHLARSKADLTSYLIHNKQHVGDFKVIEALNADVESLLRKAVSMRVDSSHLVCHIARSFMKLPHYFRLRNRNLTQFCVLQALRMSPSDPLVNHTVGLYSLMGDDVENAVYYLTEASNMGVHGASFDLCRLKWKECRKYDPVPDLTEIIEHSDEFAASEAHGLLATYYFFAKNDLISTIEHWTKWLHCCDKESYSITSMFLGQESFDFNSVLYDEVRLELNSTRYNPKDKLRLKEIIKKIEENRPELKHEKPRRQRQHLIDKAQMISKIGRAYPDSIMFFVKEQRAKKQGKTLEKKDFVKKGRRLNVSSKYNAYRREKNEKKTDGDREPTRSQSTSRVQEYKKKYGEEPFWRPPRRHRSMDRLNKDDKNDGSAKNAKKNDESEMDKRKTVGSGRIICEMTNLNRGMVKAASMETLLLVKSYEPKKGYNQKSSSNYWRSSSQESLSSNFSGRSEYSEKRVFDTRPKRVSSEEVIDSSGQSNFQRNRDRSFSSREVNVRPRQPSIVEGGGGVNGSEAELPSRWRHEGPAGTDLAPKSSFFQSWSSRGQEDRPPSRAASVGARSESPLSESNKGQGDTAFRDFRRTPSSAYFQSRNKWNETDSKEAPRRNEQGNTSWSQSSSRRYGDAPTSSFFQSRSQEDRMRSSPRMSSVREGDAFQRRSNRADDESGRISLRPCTERQEDFQPRFGGREGYTPRGRSFTRGGQRDSGRQNINYREAGDAFHDSLKRLDLGRK